MKKELINSILNYSATIYIMGLSFFCNAFYFRKFGGEIFALIALVLLITTIINLLDFGFSATLLREVASSSQKKNEIKINNIVYSIESIFNLLCLFITISVLIYLNNLPKSWEYLFSSEKINIKWLSIIITALILTKFYSVIYRAGIIGLGKLLEYNLILIIFNTLRYLLPVIYLIFISNDIYPFFLINLAVALLEFFVLRFYFYNCIFIKGVISSRRNINWSYFKNIFSFSISIGIASIFIIINSNADRILLSNVLPVKEFGYFSLLLLISASMIGVATPIFTAFMPRLINLVADNDVDAMYTAYAFMTKIITLAVTMSTMFLITFSYDIIYLISGDVEASNWSKEILIFHVLGSLFFIFNSFLYYLQNALGRYKVHLLGSALSFFIYVPLLIYYVRIEGAMGAAVIWFLFNCIWFCTWGILFHLRVNFYFFIKWIIFGIAPIILFSTLMGLILWYSTLYNLIYGEYRLYIGMIIFLLMITLGFLTIDIFRLKLRFFFNKYFI